MTEQERIKSYSALKAQIEQLAAQKKKIKTEIDSFEKMAIQFLRQSGKRYIDESGNGTGPYWTLCKDSKDGTWKKERYEEFFAWLLTDVRKGVQHTPETLTAAVHAFLKQYEKRDLKLEKHTTARRKDTKDLEEWLATGKSSE